MNDRVEIFTQTFTCIGVYKKETVNKLEEVFKEITALGYIVSHSHMMQLENDMIDVHVVMIKTV